MGVMDNVVAVVAAAVVVVEKSMFPSMLMHGPT